MCSESAFLRSCHVYIILLWFLSFIEKLAYSLAWQLIVYILLNLILPVSQVLFQDKKKSYKKKFHQKHFDKFIIIGANILITYTI